MKVFLAAIIAMLFCGCKVTYEKALAQITTAAQKQPEAAAAYFADNYPCEDSIVIGEPVIINKTDTVYVDNPIPAGNDFEWQDSTYMKGDTVYRIKKVPVSGPTRIITNTRTISRVDTIYQTDKAALKACEEKRDRSERLLEAETADRKKFEKKAKSRFWIIVGIGAAGLLGLFFAIRRKASPLKAV